MIPIQRPFLGREELDAVRGVFDSRWLGMGSVTKQFEDRLRDYLGACWAVAYRGDNDYGDSIQGPWYHQAFRHGLPGWEAVR